MMASSSVILLGFMKRSSTLNSPRLRSVSNSTAPSVSCGVRDQVSSPTSTPYRYGHGSGEGIRVLGIPVYRPGSDTELLAAWGEASEGLTKVLRIIGRIPDAQVAHHLLRSCADGCRLNHLLRATNSYLAPDWVSECHESILSSFEDLAGLPLDPHQRIQACSPVRVGGCGLKGPDLVQPAARIAALTSFYASGGLRVGAPAYCLTVDTSLVEPVLADLQSRLGPNFDPLAAWAKNPERLLTANGDQQSQQCGARLSVNISSPTS